MSIWVKIKNELKINFVHCHVSQSSKIELINLNIYTYRESKLLHKNFLCLLFAANYNAINIIHSEIPDLVNDEIRMNELMNSLKEFQLSILRAEFSIQGQDNSAMHNVIVILHISLPFALLFVCLCVCLLVQTKVVSVPQSGSLWFLYSNRFYSIFFLSTLIPTSILKAVLDCDFDSSLTIWSHSVHVISGVVWWWLDHYWIMLCFAVSVPVIYIYIYICMYIFRAIQYSIIFAWIYAWVISSSTLPECRWYLCVVVVVVQWG